jgi:Calcineurin-like phosphoesterase
MKLQVVSDVHLEFLSSAPKIEKHGDCLALLGDIGNPFSEIYKFFLQEQALQFGLVLVLLGNHEYYQRRHTAAEVVEQAHQVCDAIEGVHLLERACFTLSAQTVVLGCTLWSDISDLIATRINDFRKIKGTRDVDGRRRLLTAAQYREWHNRDLAFLEAACSSHKGKDVIVLTHHGPLHVMNGKYENGLLTSAFATDLTHLFQPPVTAFCSGHTHSSCDVVVNGIRSVSNMLGYQGERDTGYKPNVCVDYK